ncbi:MAG: flagellar basal-body MS-ring/collar protein FliF, partial [Dehalococcoidales bacterium]|nr:flagellar basal-body MS-ring/collar protein FliF [Dehalococcoidales bacterium]
PYQLAADGTTVRVPASKVYEVRLQLAAEGLPTGGAVGFELFDRTNLAVTDFAQRLNYQRGLEGELARTIGTLGPVASARVHLVIPEPELYKQKEQEATASVVLGLRPGRGLDDKQVRAIANLVAGSVEGLKPSNLTIVDTAGNMLTDGQAKDSSLGTLSSGQMEIQRAYERFQASRVQAMLDRVLGPDKATVTVNAVLNWDQVEQSIETYGPDGQPGQLRSESETRELYPGSGTAIGGIPGPSSNIPSYVGVGETRTTPTPTSADQVTPTPASANQATPTPASDSQNGDYGRIDVVRNYEISKTVEHVVQAPGSVKRMSVAVVLDELADQSHLEEISNTISAAVGLDESRGDVISVTSLPFDRSLQAEDTAAAEQAQQMQLYQTIGFAAAAVLAVIFLGLFLRRLSKALAPLPVAVPTTKTTVTMDAPALPEADPSQLAYQRLSSLAKTQPQTIAMVVRSWLDQN